MKAKIFFFLCFSILIGSLFHSCKNDIDIIAPYKDTTIVYSLLDMDDSVHFVRIHRSFIGAGDAYVLAQQADSFYHSNTLTVKLERWRNGQLLGITNFMRDSSIVKDTGIFATTPNIVYKSEYCNGMSSDSKYRLVIRNSQNGSEVTAAADALGGAKFISPASGTVNINPGPLVIKLNSGKNGKEYNVRCVFNYVEENINNPGVFINKKVTWNITTASIKNMNGSEVIEYSVAPTEFYSFLASVIPVDKNVKRYSGMLDFYATGVDYNTFEYFRINNAGGLNTENALLFTNVNNGLGVFGIKRTDASISKTLNGSSTAYLVAGPQTAALGFVQ